MLIALKKVQAHKTVSHVKRFAAQRWYRYSGDMHRFLLGMVGVAVFFVIALPQVALANTALLKEVKVSPASVAALKNKSFTLKVGTKQFVAPAASAKLWYKTRTTSNGTVYLQLRPQAIYDYLNVSISPRVNDLGTSSRFTYAGKDVQLLAGGSKGKIVDGITTSLAIRTALSKGVTTAPVSMKEYRPGVFSAADFKQLKFPDLLGKGESSFAGSPRNRIHNIGVAVARYNGLVVQPGEEFSFNGYLGDVDAENGYLPELVIKENVTTPEFGGGICQVSTTAFRAAMYSGLDVSMRRNHSYPVAYYGTPGFDATVYQPSPDLRFINDTGSPVHLRTSIVGSKVIFEFWGKSDGRTIKINGPFITEKKPDGSITAAVAQIVTKNGKSIREENFVSKYQSADKFPHVRKANGEQ